MNLSRTQLLVVGGVVLVLAHQQGQAETDRVVRQYQFDTQDVTAVAFRGSVGEMHFSPSPDHQVHVELVIEPQKRGWFNRKQNFDEVELDSRMRGNRLILMQNNEETRTIWRVQLPALLQTNIDFGVGEVKGVFGATALDVDLGVGDVDVELPLASTGQVSLSAGVGETRLNGGNNPTVDRAFVSHEVRGRGDGDFEVHIEVGVGDVEASLR